MAGNNNFIVISNYNNDISWVPNYTHDYIVCNRGERKLPEAIEVTKCIQQPNVGYNLYDYFTYIVENYSNLPPCVVFIKGNIFPRHVSKEYFDTHIHTTVFTPLVDKSMIVENKPISFFDSKSGYSEVNNSWYCRHHELKYFYSYNDFLSFCYTNPTIPKYVSFAPGANYIVPRENILKLPEQFYKNLIHFISYTQLPGEAHIIERALYTLWTSSFEISKKMLVPYNEQAELSMMTTRKYKIIAINYFRKISTILNKTLRRIHKLQKRCVLIFKDKKQEIRLKKKFQKKVSQVEIKKILSFPVLESDALQAKCDYSFGAHSGILGHVPGAFTKKANSSNSEFTKAVHEHKGNVMTLFIDNVRLYHRVLPYRDWLHMKPVDANDKTWLDSMADEDLLELLTHFPEKKFIIFTALEDNPLDKEIDGRIPENVLLINAANAVYFGGKIHPYPHGLERKMYWGYNHHTILKYFLLDNREAKKLLYVNHRNDTGNRGSLYSLFSNKSWATVSPRTDYANYLDGIKNHKFVLCPSGNGIESARNWETLYMKRVPVFKRHPYLEEMFKDFPALFVDDYAQVTEELLLQNEHLYQEALKMNMNKLNLDVVFKQRTTL